MGNVVALISTIYLLFTGVKIFRNPEEFQKKELKRIEFYKFLLKFKWTRGYYFSLLKRRSSEEYLNQIKLTSLVSILLSILLFFILILKFYNYITGLK